MHHNRCGSPIDERFTPGPESWAVVGRSA